MQQPPPRLPLWLQILGAAVIVFVLFLFIIAAADSIG